MIGALLLVKLVAKLAGVWPIATAFRLPPSKAQYTELVTVVVLSAFVPTLIAQQFFKPDVIDSEVPIARSR